MRPLLSFLLLAIAAPASGEWLRLRSPEFDLLTDAGEKTGRRAILKLEQIRQVFRDIGGDHRASPLPVRVHLFRREKDFRRYRPSANTRGFFRGGPEANYIVMHLGGTDIWRVTFHEYIHLVLNHSALRLPQWLEEGTAEFYSTVRPEKDKLIIGGVIRNHVDLLRREPWLTADELARVDHDSPVYNERARAGLFYAQSWALVHMLNMSPDYRQGMPRYAGQIAEGVPAGEAFEKAFGRTLASTMVDLRNYVKQSRWPVVQIAWEPPEKVAIKVDTLSDIEATTVELDLQLSMGLWAVSKEQLLKLASEKGNTPEIESARARVAMGRHDFEQATKHFVRAIEMGSRQASTYFEYAMLLRETDGDRARVAEFLRKTVELNPHYAEAHFLLSAMAATDGRHDEAIESLRLATSVLPRQANFWHALALSYHATGKVELARRSARRALNTARTPQEREMAEAAIHLTTKTEPVRLTGRREVHTPASWYNKQGDSRVEGELVRIDCLGESARLHVRSGDETVALNVADPAKVVLKNVSSVTFQFSCGDVAPRPVAVEHTGGEVTAIEFR